MPASCVLRAPPGRRRGRDDYPSPVVITITVTVPGPSPSPSPMVTVAGPRAGPGPRGRGQPEPGPVTVTGFVSNFHGTGAVETPEFGQHDFSPLAIPTCMLRLQHACLRGNALQRHDSSARAASVASRYDGHPLSVWASRPVRCAVCACRGRYLQQFPSSLAASARRPKDSLEQCRHGFQ